MINTVKQKPAYKGLLLSSDKGESRGLRSFEVQALHLLAGEMLGIEAVDRLIHEAVLRIVQSDGGYAIEATHPGLLQDRVDFETPVVIADHENTSVRYTAYAEKGALRLRCQAVTGNVPMNFRSRDVAVRAPDI